MRVIMIHKMMTCCFDYVMISPTACPAAGEGDTKPFDSSVVSLGQAIAVFCVARLPKSLVPHTGGSGVARISAKLDIWRAKTR